MMEAGRERTWKRWIEEERHEREILHALVLIESKNP